MSTKKTSTPPPSEPTIGATPRVAGAVNPPGTTATPAAEKAKKEKAQAPERDKKNGVTRPAKGTTTGFVWETADKLSAKHQRPATREEVAEACGEMNSSTVATQYGKWRRYYGLPRIRKMPEAPAEGASEAPASPATEAPEASVEEGDETGENE